LSVPLQKKKKTKIYQR